MTAKQRYHVHAHGLDDRAMEVAMDTAVFLAEEHRSPIVILVDCLESASGNPSLPAILGAEEWSRLMSHHHATLRGTEILIREVESIADVFPITVALAAFTSAETLAMLEGRADVKTIVAVPWLPAATAEWEREFGSRLLRRNAANICTDAMERD